MLTTLLFALEIKFVLKIESSAWGISRILCYKTLIKHLRSGKSTQEAGRNNRLLFVFLPTLLYTALQQNRAQLKLICWLNSTSFSIFRVICNPACNIWLTKMRTSWCHYQTTQPHWMHSTEMLVPQISGVPNSQRVVLQKDIFDGYF